MKFNIWKKGGNKDPVWGELLEKGEAVFWWYVSLNLQKECSGGVYIKELPPTTTWNLIYEAWGSSVPKMMHGSDWDCWTPMSSDNADTRDNGPMV